jgi:aldehyde dehydrogenase (NAD+)
MVDRTPPAVRLRIGDQTPSTGSGGVHAHVSPCTGKVDATVPLAGTQEVDGAVGEAQQAFESWRRAQPDVRRAALWRLAELIEANAGELGRLGTLDNGIPNASGAMARISAEWTRYYAGWCDKLATDVVGTVAENGAFSYTVGQPYGVLAAITTWNAPLLSLAMKVPAMLAAANTVVVKPSELTPFTGQLFMDLLAQAGFPPGVVNLLPGAVEAGEALVAHPLVQKVSFTGGPSTAGRILHVCADSMKPVVLELGGKSANIIFEDADLARAVSLGTVMSCGLMAGQSCNFGTRMLVQRGVYEEVVNQVKSVAGSFKIGDPFEPGVMAGPVISETALQRVLGMIERAEGAGARLVAGGHRLGGDLADGYYIAPTVFADVDPDSELAQTEVFGPVLAITPFDTEEEAIDMANNSRYGLSGYVHTADVRRSLRVAEELVTGEVLINGAASLVANRPYGGAKMSGLGKEGGRQGIEEFLRVKSIGIAG